MNLLPSCHHHIRAVLCSVKTQKAVCVDCTALAAPAFRFGFHTHFLCHFQSFPSIDSSTLCVTLTNNFCDGPQAREQAGTPGIAVTGVWGGEGEVLHGARARAGWVREIGVGGRGQRRWARRLCEWHCICTSLFVSQLLHALIRRVVYVEARFFTVTICFDFGFECLPDQYFDPLLFR